MGLWGQGAYAPGPTPPSAPQCDNKNQDDCTVYKFSSGVSAIQEWYKLHFMNIMAQISEEEKQQMSYSAEELILSCFFDGVSCDARSGCWGRGSWGRRGRGRPKPLRCAALAGGDQASKTYLPSQLQHPMSQSWGRGLKCCLCPG